MEEINVLPELPQVVCMETINIPCELRNVGSQTLVITRVQGTLRDDRPGGVGVPFDAVIENSVLEPKYPTTATLRIQATPTLPVWTSQYDLEVTCQVVDQGHMHEVLTKRFERVGSIVMKPRDETELTVFISFKDEEYALADRMRGLLKVVGIQSYIARDDHQLGHLIWGNGSESAAKIPTAIRGSNALLVMWTRAAEEDPRNIEREIKIASDIGMPIMLARDISCVRLPTGYDPDSEYEPIQIRYTGPASLNDAVLGPVAEKVYSRLAR